jgi:hypothetical protein
MRAIRRRVHPQAPGEALRVRHLRGREPPAQLAEQFRVIGAAPDGESRGELGEAPEQDPPGVAADLEEVGEPGPGRSRQRDQAPALRLPGQGVTSE